MRKAKFAISTMLAMLAVFAAVTTVFFTEDAAAHGAAYEYHVGDTAFLAPIA